MKSGSAASWRVDRHVLAAAIVGKVERIITFNMKDFPLEAVQRYNIRVQDPDSFILELLDAKWTRVLDALRRQRAVLAAPPLSAQQLLDALERAGLARTAQRLRPFTAEL